MAKFCMAVWVVLVCATLPGDCAFAASGGASFTPAINQDMLPVAMQGTHNAYESIRSGKGTVVIQRTMYYPDGKVSQKLEMIDDIAFSGNKFKDVQQITILENNPGPEYVAPFPAGHVIKHQLSDDGIRIVSFRPDKSGYSAIYASDPDKLREVAWDAWFRACMRGDRGIMDLSKFGAARRAADVVTGPTVIGREIIDGDECIVVEGSVLRSASGLRRIEHYWVNPNKGFVIPRHKVWQEGAFFKERTLGGESDTQFREYADGVWAQVKDVSDSYIYDPKTGVNSISMHVETTYRPDFQVNIPVSDSDLQLTLPSGTRVKDEIRSADYIVP